MELKLKKQPQKYLASVDAPTRKKLYRGAGQPVQAGGRYRPAQGICEPIPL